MVVSYVLAVSALSHAISSLTVNHSDVVRPAHALWGNPTYMSRTCSLYTRHFSADIRGIRLYDEDGVAYFNDTSGVEGIQKDQLFHVYRLCPQCLGVTGVKNDLEMHSIAFSPMTIFITVIQGVQTRKCQGYVSACILLIIIQ